jgi:CMP-N,N'-diacetyllegionaminic acid synthase
MRNTFCVIPARSGSKGVKNKNIIKFKNKTLIRHTLDFAKKLSFVSKIVISTDSFIYLNKSKISKKYYNNLRPKKLSKDNSSTIDVVIHEFNNLTVKEQELIKYILILQPTCPFRLIKHFNKAYNHLKKDLVDSALTINEVKEHPNRMIKFHDKGLISNYIGKSFNLKPRQKLKKLYIRAGSMYFFKKKNILKKNIFGKKVLGIEVFDKFKINIDSEEDLFKTKEFFKK